MTNKLDLSTFIKEDSEESSLSEQTVSGGTTTANVAHYEKPVKDKNTPIRRSYDNAFSKQDKNSLLNPSENTKLSYSKYSWNAADKCPGCELIKEFGLGMNSRNSNLTCQYCGASFKQKKSED